VPGADGCGTSCWGGMCGISGCCGSPPGAVPGGSVTSGPGSTPGPPGVVGGISGPAPAQQYLTCYLPYETCPCTAGTCRVASVESLGLHAQPFHLNTARFTAVLSIHACKCTIRPLKSGFLTHASQTCLTRNLHVHDLAAEALTFADTLFARHAYSSRSAFHCASIYAAAQIISLRRHAHSIILCLGGPASAIRSAAHLAASRAPASPHQGWLRAGGRGRPQSWSLSVPTLEG